MGLLPVPVESTRLEGRRARFGTLPGGLVAFRVRRLVFGGVPT